MDDTLTRFLVGKGHSDAIINTTATSAHQSNYTIPLWMDNGQTVTCHDHTTCVFTMGALYIAAATSSPLRRYTGGGQGVIAMYVSSQPSNEISFTWTPHSDEGGDGETRVVIIMVVIIMLTIVVCIGIAYNIVIICRRRKRSAVISPQQQKRHGSSSKNALQLVMIERIEREPINGTNEKCVQIDNFLS